MKNCILTGTRADFGKIKSLLNKIEQLNDFELAVFVTGMHLLKKYGGTVKEVQDAGIPIYTLILIKILVIQWISLRQKQFQGFQIL